MWSPFRWQRRVCFDVSLGGLLIVIGVILSVFMVAVTWAILFIVVSREGQPVELGTVATPTVAHVSYL